MQIATQLSSETKAIADLLRKAAVGEDVPYTRLSSEVGRDVQRAAHGALDSARRILLREGVRFDVVRGVGLRRMTDAEIAKSGARSVRLLHSAARREGRKMATVAVFDALTEEEKILHNTTLSVLGAVAHFTTPRQVKILEAAVATARAKLPVADTVEAVRRALQPASPEGR